MRNLFVLALLLVSLRPTLGQKLVPVETISKVKQSIIPIVCGYVDENNVFQLVQVAGTGFFVDIEGRFITAGHVLDGWENISRTKHPCFSAFYVPDRGWKGFEKHIAMQWFTFTNCVKNSELDLAVCTPIENPFTSKRISRDKIAVVTFDTNEWPEGTAVAFSGFPLQSVVPISSKGFIGGYLGIDGNDTYFEYIVDKAAWPGASGSPLYLPNGAVIGIVRMRGQNEASGLAYARCASAITDFLKQNPPTNSKKQSQPATQP
jgi:hypothetical protein